MTGVFERLPRTWVAEAGDVLHGFVVIAGDEIEQVYVRAAARRTGVGRMLIGYAEQVVADAGHVRAWLAVASGNSLARTSFEALGWTDVGRHDDPAQAPDAGASVPMRRYAKHVSVS